jgi:uncharacterized protein YjiS (DUF1127 family)
MSQVAPRIIKERSFRPRKPILPPARTAAIRSGAILSQRVSTTAIRLPAFAARRQFLVIDLWSALTEKWRVWKARIRQRAALRDIADDPHLLADLGLSRDEALAQANKPFWR